MDRPLVGIPCCIKTLRGHDFHAVGDRYIRAVTDSVGGFPLLIPALGPWYDLDVLIDRLDGVLITGSPSNVEPRHYEQDSRPGTLHDPARDATTLPLLRAAVMAGVPVLGICRGIQELNVALGGSLHQHVHELPGRLDHRGGADKPIEVQYGPKHPVRLTPGGLLSRLYGRDEILVNSVHGQGIDRLAPSLTVEAVAPDGQIEAVRVKGRSSFGVGVQWHPEWRLRDNPDSVTLFDAFARAVHGRAAARTQRLAAE